MADTISDWNEWLDLNWCIIWFVIFTTQFSSILIDATTLLASCTVPKIVEVNKDTKCSSEGNGGRFKKDINCLSFDLSISISWAFEPAINYLIVSKKK